MNKRKTSFKVQWLNDQVQKLRKIYSPEEVSNEELKTILLDLYDKRKTVTGRFYNNTTKENRPMTIEGFINYSLNNDYVLTGYNTLMKNQDSTKTIAIEALEFILNQRSIYKKKMQEADKGSNDYIYYKVLQLTFKILANSYYGILSMGGSIFYNPFIQNSITTTGQDLISTAIYLVESFIANNERFKSMDEIIKFITDVSNETNYNILDYINIVKTPEEVKRYLISQSDFDVNTQLLDKLILRRSSEELNKVYYKNQIVELMKNEYFSSNVRHVCVNDEIDKDLVNIMATILNYNEIAWDRFIRISHQKRQASIVTDTDLSVGSVMQECINENFVNCWNVLKIKCQSGNREIIRHGIER